MACSRPALECVRTSRHARCCANSQKRWARIVSADENERPSCLRFLAAPRRTESEAASPELTADGPLCALVLRDLEQAGLADVGALNGMVTENAIYASVATELGRFISPPWPSGHRPHSREGQHRPWPPASGRGPRYPSAVTLMAAAVGQFETARGKRETAVLRSPAFLFSEGPLALPSEVTDETRTRR
jgi:hypothetical protein